MSTYNIPAPTSAYESKPKHELMPPGDYDLEVVYASDKDADGNLLTTRAGDPRIKLKVMDEDERSFYHFLYLSEKAFPMVWEFLTACGIKTDGDFTLDPIKLEGKRFRASVYEEKGWNRLRKPIPVPETDQSTPDPETQPEEQPTAPDEDVPF